MVDPMTASVLQMKRNVFLDFSRGRLGNRTSGEADMADVLLLETFFQYIEASLEHRRVHLLRVDPEMRMALLRLWVDQEILKGQMV